MFIVESYAVAIIMCFITMISGVHGRIQPNLSAIKNGSSLILLGLFNWIIAVFFVICLHAGSMGEAGRSFIPDIQQASSIV